MRAILLLYMVLALFGCDLPSAPQIDNRFDPAHVDPIPTAPVNLNLASSTSNSITLSWEDRSSIETEFIIEQQYGMSRDFIRVGQVPANTVTFTKTLEPNWNTFQYRIVALKGTVRYGSTNVIILVYQFGTEKWTEHHPSG